MTWTETLVWAWHLSYLIPAGLIGIFGAWDTFFGDR